MRRLAQLMLAALCVPLCLATLIVGARSLWRGDKIEYVSPANRLLLLNSRHGRLDLYYHGNWTSGDPGILYIPSSLTAQTGADDAPRLLGFATGRRPNGTRFVNIPYWFPALLLALPPALTIRSESRRRRRPRHAACPTCGYDLRATPDRCPECGTLTTDAT